MLKAKSKYKGSLLILNIIIAACFIISCYGGHFNHWVLEFFVLGGFYFLVINLIFLFSWLFIRPRFALISMVAIIICLVPVKHLVGLRFANQLSVQKPSNTFRIMNWNVDRFDVMSDNSSSLLRAGMYGVVKDYNPDLACFVEMVATKTDSTKMNFLPQMLREMNMEKHFYVFDDDEFYIRGQQFGKIIISKFPIINSGIHAWHNKQYNYRLLFADIAKSTDTVRVFVLHLQSLKFNHQEKNITSLSNEGVSQTVKTSRGIVGKIKSGFLERTAQADSVSYFIRQSPYPVVVCGDFNDVPNSYAYNKIGEGLQNAFAEKGSGLGKTYAGLAPTLRIDNIFLSKNFKVISFQTLKKQLSDHYPQITDVQF